MATSTKRKSKKRESNNLTKSISSSSFHESLTFYYGVVCLLVYALDLSEALRIPTGVTSQMFVQLFTYHCAHRDMQHLAGNVGTVLLLGPHLEELMGKEKFWAMSALTVLSGGIVGISLEAGLQGSSGLLIAYAIMFLRFSDSLPGRKSKRKSHDIDLSVLLVVILSLSRVFWEYPQSNFSFNETNSEFAHIFAGLIGAVAYPHIFGPYKDRAKSSTFHVSSPFKKQKKEEEVNFRAGIRNIFRRGEKSDSESDSEEETKKGLLSRFRKKNKKTKKADSDSDSSDDGYNKKRPKGIYSNIPKEKLKGKRFHDESDSDYSD